MKKRIFLKAMALTGAVAMGLSVAQASAAELNVGANIGNVPWEFQDASGKIVGFEVDLMTEVGKAPRHGGRDRQHPVPGPVRGRAVGPDRRGGVLDHHHQEAAGIGQLRAALLRQRPVADRDKADSGITGLAGMEGKTVGVDTGSTGDMWTTQNQATTKIGTISKYEGLAPAMLDLEAGRIDGYISDIPALLYYVKDKPQFKVVERIKTTEQYSVMFAKDSPLARQGQRCDHRNEEGRNARQDPRDLVRHEARRRPGDDDRARHAEAVTASKTC